MYFEVKSRKIIHCALGEPTQSVKTILGQQMFAMLIKSNRASHLAFRCLKTYFYIADCGIFPHLLWTYNNLLQSVSSRPNLEFGQSNHQAKKPQKQMSYVKAA